MSVDYLESAPVIYSPEARARALIAAEIKRLGYVEDYEAHSGELGSSVLKLYNLCNLACDYCYEYEGPDQSYRDLPPVMSEATITAAGEATATYARMKGKESWPMTLHGGEALMIGPTVLDRAATLLREAFEEHAPDTELELTVVTNGVKLTKTILNVAKKHDMRVVVSLDGDEKAHNRHRINKAGHGTFKQVARGINLLRDEQYRHLYGGLLAVMDTKNDPIEVYEALCSFDPPDIDFILPYASWDNLPPAYANTRSSLWGTPYADWLITVFDRWQQDKMRHAVDPHHCPKPPGIRFFQSIKDLDLGDISSTEALGLYTGNEFIVRTDGSVELVDGLKMTFDGAVKTDMNIHNNDVETIADRFRVMGQLGRKVLSYECEACPVVKICGGHHVATRYWQGSFLNPSVYCDDLMKLITHVQLSSSQNLHDAQVVADDFVAVRDWSARIKNSGMGRYLRRQLERHQAIVRQATAHDVAAMVDIIKESLRADYLSDEHGLTVDYWDSRCDAEWRQAKEAFLWAHYIEATDGSAYVTEVDEAVVGFSLTKDNEYAGTYVRKGMRRRRIATALLERSLTMMVDSGYANTWAGVALDISKSAAAFYRASGFVNTGEIIGEGHNGRPGAFADYRMNLSDLPEVRDKTRRLLGIGAVAAGASTQINLNFLSLLSLRLLYLMIGRAVRAFFTRSLCLSSCIEKIKYRLDFLRYDALAVDTEMG